jgi:uncharacterized protein (DUF302 family)
MTAKEARKLAEASKGNPAEMAEVKSKITAAAKNGQDFIWFYRVLNADVQRQLTVEGYDVFSEFDRGETLVKISW